MLQAQAYRTSIGRRLSVQRYRKTPRGLAAIKRYEHSINGVAARRNRRLLLKYGMSALAWNTLFEAQGFCCAVCKSTEPGRKDKQWHTDHDHVTKEVRGILCLNCNAAMGLVKDDPNRLRMLAEYLEKEV